MDRQFKVLLYEPMHQEGTMLLEEKGNVIYAKSYDEDTIIRQVNDVNAIIIWAGRLAGKLLSQLPNLK